MNQQQYGPEPVLDYNDPATDAAWHAWAAAHSDEDLRALVDRMGAWCPNDDPQADPDAQAVKYDMAVDLLNQRAKRTS